jgi:hypothetical protein
VVCSIKRRPRFWSQILSRQQICTIARPSVFLNSCIIRANFGLLVSLPANPPHA